MVIVESSDKATFTSALSQDPKSNLTLNIESEYHEDEIGFSVLRIDAELIDVDVEIPKGDVTTYIGMRKLSGESVPALQHIPESTSRVNLSFTFHRGPLHPQEMCETDVRFIVSGFDNYSDAREDVNGTELGSAVATLHG